MSTKVKVLIGAAALATAFAVGRYTTPEKVKVETKVVEVEKKVQDKQQNKRKDTKVVETKDKDGNVVITKTTTETTTTDTKTTDDKNSTSDTKSETTKGSSPTTVSVLFAYDALSKGPVYGASVYKPVLGPVGIGIFGLSNKTLGCSIGLSF